MDENGIGSVIGRALERAAQATGVLTGLISISALGLGALALPPADAIALAVFIFGAVGALEVHHRQSSAKAIERSKSEHAAKYTSLMLSAVDKRPEWNAKKFKELRHGGFKWYAVGFEQVPAPLTVTGPLCPACGSHLAERFKVAFPGRLRITIYCDCGFTKRSDRFIGELHTEAHQLAGGMTG